MGTPVSGPGKFSERTDKAVENANLSTPNADYGEAKENTALRQAAPMAGASGGVNFNTLFGDLAGQVTGLGEPTSMPDTPVTDGADAGPGAGSEILGPPPPDPKMEQMRAWIPALEWMANQPNSGDSSRNLLRAVKANLGM